MKDTKDPAEQSRLLLMRHAKRAQVRLDDFRDAVAMARPVSASTALSQLEEILREARVELRRDLMVGSSTSGALD